MRDAYWNVKKTFGYLNLNEVQRPRRNSGFDFLRSISTPPPFFPPF